MSTLNMTGLVILLTMTGISSCSSTVKGPVTRQKYNVEVGGAENMEDYRRQRKQVLKPEVPAEEKRSDNCGFDQPDCSVVVQPDAK